MNTSNTYLQLKGFLNTPSIFNNKNKVLGYPIFHLQSSNLQFIEELDINENLMLGKRVESFFKHYISVQKHYQICVENLQIFQNKITIGELDFIINNSNDHTKHHIELTYKFYLFDPNHSSSEIENWIGPNRNDSLVQKINKLTQKQFPLLYSDFIEEPFIVTHKNEITQHACFLAQLFIPYSHKNHIFENLNTKAINGFYISYTEFLNANLDENEFQLPKKQDWLIQPEDNQKWFPFETVSEELKHAIVKKKSPLLWVKDAKGRTKSLFITWW